MKIATIDIDETEKTIVDCCKRISDAIEAGISDANECKAKNY